jgi:hypothetical protein
MSHRVVSHARRAVLRPAIVIALAGALGGCSPESSAAPVNLPRLAGEYRMTRANGMGLPASMSTSWAQGTIVAGSLKVSPELEYWMGFSVQPPAGGPGKTFQLHGFIQAAKNDPQAILFFDDHGTLQFQGTFAGLLIEIGTLKEMQTTAFTWFRPYTFPA